MRFEDIKKLNDKKLLVFTKKVYELSKKGFCDDLVENWFINEVSRRHYGFEDVMGSQGLNEFYICLDEDEEFVKLVKKQTADKWIKEGDRVGKYGGGRSWHKLSMVRSILGNDCGQLFII